VEEQEIDFERAHFEQHASPELQCKSCGESLTTYHTLNGEPLCARCLGQANAGRQGSFIKAVLLGSIAGTLGAALYYGISALTGYELGLVAIVVGIMVGVAVRMGGDEAMPRRLSAATCPIS